MPGRDRRIESTAEPGNATILNQNSTVHEVREKDQRQRAPRHGASTCATSGRRGLNEQQEREINPASRE